MLRLTILGPIWDEICRSFAAEPSSEEGGFYLARSTATSSGILVSIDRSVPPPDAGKWRLQNFGQLAPTTAYMSRAAGMADRERRIPVFIHNHPGGPARFSETDEWAFESWEPFFRDTCSTAGFVAVVVAGRSLVADLWVDGVRAPFHSVSCGGQSPRHSFRQSSDLGDDDGTRQQLFWKEVGQQRLKTARVAIVGVGGTGSACAIQLARTGIGGLVLVDPDAADTTNLNRLYGLSSLQASAGAPKVEVVRDRISGVSRTEVVPIRKSVLDPSVLPSLLDCDLILVCTDSDGSRALVNQIPSVYGTPVVDVGCKGESSQGEVLAMWSDVRRLESGGPCLWCMGVLDAAKIASESFPGNTRENAVRDDYYQGGGAEPSTIGMTTLGATFASIQAVSRILDQDTVWPTEYLFDLWTATVHVPGVVKRMDCVCGTNRWEPTILDPAALRTLFADLEVG